MVGARFGSAADAPGELEIDTCDGAWGSITPLTMWGIRPMMLPRGAGIERFARAQRADLRARRVDAGGWFFSLDASNAVAVLAARLGFHLPYLRANMQMEESGNTLSFSSKRTDPTGPSANFSAKWSRGAALPAPGPDSLEFFLAVDSLASTMAESHGFKLPGKPALVHAQADPLAVDVWLPRRI